MDILGALGSAVDFVADIGGGIMDSIGSAIADAIATVAGKGMFYILVDGLLSVVKTFWELFSVFAGITRVKYNGSYDYLISVFFANREVNNIYWGMALIGIIMVVVFTIISVIRKMFDINDKQQRSLGGILGSSAKGFLIILLLSWFMSAVLSFSNVLMQQVTYLFNNSREISQRTEYRYTDQQFASMADILNTVGNYSMNPSSTSRYNLNSCFNEIRPKLYELQRQGVFDFPYEMKDANGNVGESWQSALQKVVVSADLRRDLKMDVYYEGPAAALTELMETLQNNPSIQPLEYYKWEYAGKTDGIVSIDRILFLVSTQNAAKNPEYNRNPTFTDAIRAPYYYGHKSIYNLDEVMDSFDIKIGAMSYVLLAFIAYVTLKNLWRCIIQCVVRIFSVIGLYIIAPPFIATMPMDDGEKFKQWMTAFVIQTFGIFGTVIPMRLLIMFIPMVFDAQLVIFESSALANLLAKVLLLVGGLEATNSFGGMITGILANNVGLQAVNSSERAQQKADRMFAVGQAGVVGAGKMAGRAAVGIGKFASNVSGLTTVGRGISSVVNSVAGIGGAINESMAANGGIFGAMVSGVASAEQGTDSGTNGGGLPQSNFSMRGSTPMSSMPGGTPMSSIPDGTPMSSMPGGTPSSSLPGAVPRPSVSGAVPRPSVSSAVPSSSASGGVPISSSQTRVSGSPNEAWQPPPTERGKQ